MIDWHEVVVKIPKGTKASLPYPDKPWIYVMKDGEWEYHSGFMTALDLKQHSDIVFKSSPVGPDSRLIIKTGA